MSDLEERVADLERWRKSHTENHIADREQYENDVFNRFSTLNSPMWKRMVFRLDGWGPWHTVREHPRWRPWRRWWTS